MIRRIPRNHFIQSPLIQCGSLLQYTFPSISQPTKFGKGSPLSHIHHFTFRQSFKQKFACFNLYSFDGKQKNSNSHSTWQFLKYLKMVIIFHTLPPHTPIHANKHVCQRINVSVCHYYLSNSLRNSLFFLFIIIFLIIQLYFSRHTLVWPAAIPPTFIWSTTFQVQC